jgi:pimeloyl-ACP methyl ester carboxylesterase
VPLLNRPDGVEIHWQERGDGPVVLIDAYWSGNPATVYTGLIEDLSRDHRIVTYDARGTGESTRTGPYDMDTGAADVAALIEHAGRPAVLVALADGCSRAVRVASARPDLAPRLVTVGTPPFAISAFEGTDAMLSSSSVVGAFLEMIDRDYRGALRSLLTVANQQMSEDELRERVKAQIAYCPHETAVGRVTAWATDDPGELARAMGDRLTIIIGRDVAGPWLPDREQLLDLTRGLTPAARLLELDEGPVSGPEQTADVVRDIASELR